MLKDLISNRNLQLTVSFILTFTIWGQSIVSCYFTISPECRMYNSKNSLIKWIAFQNILFQNKKLSFRGRRLTEWTMGLNVI